jgi:hypothetical protein
MPTQNRTALPVLVAHSAVLQVPAVVMPIVGGLLIYGTIISFGRRMCDDVEESVGSVRSKDARGEGVSGSKSGSTMRSLILLFRRSGNLITDDGREESVAKRHRLHHVLPGRVVQGPCHSWKPGYPHRLIDFSAGSFRCPS